MNAFKYGFAYLAFGFGISIASDLTIPQFYLRSDVENSSCNFGDQDCLKKLLELDDELTVPADYHTIYAFLEKSKTPSRKYDLKAFNCSNFAAALILEARANKIPALYVIVRFVESPSVNHAIVAFPYDDNKLIYFDPTGNIRSFVVLTMGQNPKYWQFDKNKKFIPVKLEKEMGTVRGIALRHLNTNDLQKTSTMDWAKFCTVKN